MPKSRCISAWDITTGSSDVVVAVIDSGITYTHPDLSANVWTNSDEIAGDGIDNDNNGKIDDIRGWDFVNGDNDPMDDQWHGTHVGGTIGAVENSIGMVGVSSNVQIMPLKFLGTASGTILHAIDALEYATDMRIRYNSSGGTLGANVVLTNNSWETTSYSQGLYDAIAASRDANMLFIAAAGNGGLDTDASPVYPASFDLDNIISVAATDKTDARGVFSGTKSSNWGAASIDLAAPGVEIYSTYPSDLYAWSSGTSMAAPHLSGVAALAWSVATDAHFTAIRDIILGGVDLVASFATSGSTPVVTGGRLNAYNTLQLLESNAPTVTITRLAANPTSSSQVGFLLDFDEDVQNFGTSDFELALSGTATGTITAFGQADDSDDSTYTIVVTGVGGDGTLDLNFASAQNIQDMLGNAFNPSTGITSEQVYTVET